MKCCKRLWGKLCPVLSCLVLSCLVMSCPLLSSPVPCRLVKMTSVETGSDDDFCGRCSQCPGRFARKVQQVEKVPDTVLIEVKVFGTSVAQGGVLRCRRIERRQRLEVVVTLRGQNFSLQRLVLQRNAFSPASVYHVAVARHGGSRDSFIQYDDSHRRGVPWA